MRTTRDTGLCGSCQSQSHCYYYHPDTTTTGTTTTVMSVTRQWTWRGSIACPYINYNWWRRRYVALSFELIRARRIAPKRFKSPIISTRFIADRRFELESDISIPAPRHKCCPHPHCLPPNRLSPLPRYFCTSYFHVCFIQWLQNYSLVLDKLLPVYCWIRIVTVTVTASHFTYWVHGQTAGHPKHQHSAVLQLARYYPT